MATKAKVKIVRSSGLPVKIEKLDEFKDWFKGEYDKLYNIYEKDMPTLQSKLEDLDKLASKKYSTIEEVVMPSSRKAWKDLMKSYQNSILISEHVVTGEVLLVIMDQGI